MIREPHPADDVARQATAQANAAVGYLRYSLVFDDSVVTLTTHAEFTDRVGSARYTLPYELARLERHLEHGARLYVQKRPAVIARLRRYRPDLVAHLHEAEPREGTEPPTATPPNLTREILMSQTSHAAATAQALQALRTTPALRERAAHLAEQHRGWGLSPATRKAERDEKTFWQRVYLADLQGLVFALLAQAGHPEPLDAAFELAGELTDGLHDLTGGPA